MALKVRCPNAECRQRYSVAESHLGRLATCQKCGTEFRVEPASDERPKGQPADAAPGAAAVSLPKLPERIGRFEIRSRLGAGGFGVVYRAYDTTLEREVALKVPHAGRLQTEKDRLRFLREAKAAAKLRHQNIVPVFEAGVAGEQYYMAAAFIEGQTLQEALEKKPFDFRESVRLVQELAAALYYAHMHRIVHRDVKPANIMLDATGEPLLMDFGLARFEEGLTLLTHDGALLGTPAYMAPEQALGKQEDVSPASDQYGLGVILYELLCGDTPFSGPPALVISHVINQEPPSPRSINRKIPRDLETICLKAISKRPGERYGSCADLVADLRRWQTGQSILSRRASTAERLWRWCRRNPAVAGLSAAVVFLVGLVMILAATLHTSASRMQEMQAAHVSALQETQRRAEERGPGLFAENKETTGSNEVQKTPLAKVSSEPSPAIAPFDAVKAKAHQQAWAKHLGTEVETTNSVGMKLVLIPPGEFMMGSADSDTSACVDEKPQHRVRITRPFYMGMYEVTQREYARVMGRNPSYFSPDGDGRGKVAGQDTRNFPVESVSWEDVVGFCRELSGLTVERAAKRVYRLPTEAEWEYACRAGSTTEYSSGNEVSSLGDYAWFGFTSGDKTNPVGGKKANAWGLFDVHGNVCEWCADWYDGAYYKQSRPDNPVGPSSGFGRVVRGGSWSPSNPSACRSAYRTCGDPTIHTNTIGFRVICEVPRAGTGSGGNLSIRASEDAGNQPASGTPAILDEDGFASLFDGKSVYNCSFSRDCQ